MVILNLKIRKGHTEFWGTFSAILHHICNVHIPKVWKFQKYYKYANLKIVQILSSKIMYACMYVHMYMYACCPFITPKIYCT